MLSSLKTTNPVHKKSEKVLSNIPLVETSLSAFLKVGAIQNPNIKHIFHKMESVTTWHDDNCTTKPAPTHFLDADKILFVAFTVYFHVLNLFYPSEPLLPLFPAEFICW